MISVEEAKRILMAHVKPTTIERVPIMNAAGRFLASPVNAPVDHPLFDMSAVDGYAFRHSNGANERTVVGAVAAGEVFDGTLAAGTCVRIFTGAAVPKDADTVVMQEFCSVTNGIMKHTDQALRVGGNVRRRGEQASAGDRLLNEGALLDAASIGLLASFGIAEVESAAVPQVSVVVTGNEFIRNEANAAGRIHNSNGVMLRSAMKHHAHVANVEQATDDHRMLFDAIERAEAMGDVVITTGGASVGDHDLVEQVLKDIGATIHLHGVSQKPGKPMLFATLNGTPVFGLPGNPRAVMVLFWEYVLPFLRAMQGATDPWPKKDRLPLSRALNVKGDRTEFRAVQVRNGQVILLADEGSHMLRSLVDADALAYVPVAQCSWNANDPIEVHYLPR